MSEIVFSCTTEEQDVFDAECVQRVSVDREIETQAELVSLIKRIRQQHSGILIFEKGSFGAKIKHVGEDGYLIQSGAWHTHDDADAINISNGSLVPTFMTQHETAAQAVLTTVEEFTSRFAEAGGGDWTFKMSDDETVLDGSLLYYLELSETNLNTYIDGGCAPELHNNFLDGLTFFRGPLSKIIANNLKYPEPLRDLAKDAYRRTQELVPEEQRVEVVPNDCDGYVIPTGMAHARSMLHGKIARPSSETNRNLFVDMSA